MILDDHKIRTVVENDRFAEELRAMHGNPVRADEFVDGAKGILSRNPEAGTKIGEKVWFLPMSLGAAVIYYTFDDDQVYLLSIQIVPEPNEGEP